MAQIVQVDEGARSWEWLASDGSPLASGSLTSGVGEEAPAGMSVAPYDGGLILAGWDTSLTGGSDHINLFDVPFATGAATLLASIPMPAGMYAPGGDPQQGPLKIGASADGATVVMFAYTPSNTYRVTYVSGSVTICTDTLGFTAGTHTRVLGIVVTAPLVTVLYRDGDGGNWCYADLLSHTTNLSQTYSNTSAIPPEWVEGDWVMAKNYGAANAVFVSSTPMMTGPYLFDFALEDSAPLGAATPVFSLIKGAGVVQYMTADPFDLGLGAATQYYWDAEAVLRAEFFETFQGTTEYPGYENDLPEPHN